MRSRDGETQGMDIDMCLKMLSIYLETIDNDLRDVVLQNQDKLFSQISDIKGLKTEYEHIYSQVDAITTSFNSIKSEVNASCKSIRENAVRLANFNAVVLLLRQVIAFRSGIKKIRGFLSESNPSQRAWLRAQKTYQEIEKTFNEGHLSGRWIEIIWIVDVKALAEDIRYFNEIRAKIIEHVSAKK